MRLFLLLLALSLPQSHVERSTAPTFRGAGGGTLVVLDVPENVSLEFFVVQCTRVEEGSCTFDVFRSGRRARPPSASEGESYVDEGSRVSFRIEGGDPPFEKGDTFSFVTFEDVSKIDGLLERWAGQYVKWILSREERARFETLEDPVEKLAFVESFWRRRDPTPDTVENEAREEHARRFAYAVQHFSAGTPGWATDRGKIYVLLGPPHAIERSPAGRTAYERPSEVWTYNNARNPKLPASFDVAFVDFTVTGRYELVSASNLDVLAPLRTNLGYAMSELEAIGLMRSGGTLLDPNTGLRYDIDPTALAMERFDFERDLVEIAKVPKLTLPDLRAVTEASARFPTIPLRTDVAYFHAGEGRALVPVTVSIPYARLTPAPVGDAFRYSADVLLQLDGEGAEPIEDRIEMEVAKENLESYRESELLYDASFLLEPGDYDVTATVRDNPSGAVGQATVPIAIPSLGEGTLSLSSLVLANGAVETASLGEGRSPFQFGDVRLIPNLSKAFTSGGSLTAYVEAYGLRENTQLKVELFLLRDGRLFSKVAPSYHRPGGGGEAAIRSEISLRDFPPGSYALRARVTDEASGAKAERESAFAVRAREP